MDDETIKILINKIENGLPDIKLRSIATLYTKITVGIIQHSTLPRFINLPGVLLQWINDNRNRSEPLFKVLTILSYFMKTQDGLLIMNQYQALDFFQEYRRFLLEQNPRHDQYTTLLQNLIKLLIPLQSSKNSSVNSVSQIQPESLVDLKQQKKLKENKEKDKSIKNIKEGIKMSWIVAQSQLGKKEEDELYSLLMQLRHSKRQLQLQWLKKIEQLVKYWGSKSLRFRNELISQLTQQFSRANLKWLIIGILKAIVIGVGENSRQLIHQQLNVINLSGNDKIIRPPPSQKVSIVFKKQLFESIYSYELIDQLIKYHQFSKQSDLYESLLQLGYKFSPKYFEQSLSKLAKAKDISLNVQLLNKNIEYYSLNFNHFPEKMASLLSETPESWNLTPQSFPVLKGYLQNIQKNSKISYLANYKEDWQFGSNLHNAAEVIANLQKGVQAIDLKNHKHYIRIYLNALLTLGVSVQKQDPLMSYYPAMKRLIINIAQRPALRGFLFQSILNAINSTSTIKYASKKIAQNNIAILIFSEQTMFKSMLYESFGDEESLEIWLEVASILVQKSKQYCELSSYACIFFSLTYHKNQKVRQLAKILIEALPKKGKQMIIFCRLFSVSQEQRIKISKDLFRQNYDSIYAQLQQQPPKSVQNKKLLKISENSVQNYIQIIFNNNIEQEIRLNAAKQLLDSLERIELKPSLEQLLTLLSENIAKSLNQFSSFSHSFISLLIQMNGLLNQILEQKYLLKNDLVITLLQNSLPSKAIQILLQQLYNQCFQSPFSIGKQSHFITMLYPHINFVDMKISGYIEMKEQVASDNEQIPNKNKLILSNYEESLQFSHFIQWAIYAKLNNIPIKLGQTFANIIQKQIGSVFHATKGYINLHYLAYGFMFLSKHNLQLPDKILDYSSPLLNSLLSKDQTPWNCQPIAVMISIIGCKKSRQLQALLATNPSGLWKFHILFQMDTVQAALLELIIKSLLGITYGKQAVLILRLIMAQSPKMALNKFSQSLVLSNCIKFIRQESDQLLRKTAICLLTELYKTENLECEGWEDIFSSAASVLLDQPLNINQANLLLNLIKTIIKKNEDIVNEINILKLVLQKIVSLIMIPSINQLTASIIYEIINLISLQKKELLQKFDLVDTSINFMSNICEKKSALTELNLKFVTTILDYLFIEIKNDQNLAKYLLTSTNLLKYFINICKYQQNSCFSKELFQSLARIIIVLSNIEEDLFLYKINQILKSQSLSFIQILNLNIYHGGLDYLKMIGWMMVIWLRNREELDPSLGSQMTEITLNSENPSTVKAILPFSIQAKIMFLQSKYLQQLLKENSVIIDNRLVKQAKDKKKKNKIYQLQQLQFNKLQHFLSILSALFYCGELHSNEEIKQCQGLKRILIFIQKMYSCGQWDQQITRSYLKVVTNMALSQPFTNACSNRLSQNAIMIEQMIGSILKSESSEGIVKLSLKLMSVLVHLELIRAIVLRAKVIQELSIKLIKGEESGDLNLEYTMDVIEVLISFSTYKDSNLRLLNDKRLLEVLLRIIKLGKFSILQEKIVTLLSNLACFKSNKSTFMSNKDIHKIILGLLQDQDISYHQSLLILLYNILYKNSAALKLYRRNDVIEVIKNATSKQESDVNKALLQALLCEQSN